MTEPALLTKKGPEWKYVVVLNQPGDEKGTAKGAPNLECLHCETKFRGGASRIRAHLLGGPGIAKCKDVQPEAVTALAQQHAAKELEGAKKRKIAVCC